MAPAEAPARIVVETAVENMPLNLVAEPFRVESLHVRRASSPLCRICARAGRRG